ncbi:MAG: hypothetical protein GY851_31065 [bacterium]|nr:hypothetical protein [bacterium]
MLHLRNWTLLVGLALLAAACSPSAPQSDPAEPSEPTAADPAPMVPMAPDPAVAEPEFNIGDVEQGIDIEAAVAPESTSARIGLDPLVSRDGRVKILTLNVKAPYPEELWLTYAVNARTAFDKRPVVLRGRFLRDKRQELGTFAVVLGANAQRNEFITKVNILEGLDVAGETIGITVDAEALLLPEGTDVSTVDTASVTAPEAARSKALYHTTVVVYFEDAPAAPASDGGGSEGS